MYHTIMHCIIWSLTTEQRNSGENKLIAPWKFCKVVWNPWKLQGQKPRPMEIPPGVALSWTPLETALLFWWSVCMYRPHFVSSITLDRNSCPTRLFLFFFLEWPIFKTSCFFCNLELGRGTLFILPCPLAPLWGY